MRGFCFSDLPHKAYPVNSHTKDHKAAITKHIAKVRSGQIQRTWWVAKLVRLPRKTVPADKPRETPPPLLTHPIQIPIAKPKHRVEISTNNANYMGIHPFHQSDASELQQDVAGKKINLTDPDPGNISQGKNSNTKVHND